MNKLVKLSVSLLCLLAVGLINSAYASHVRADNVRFKSLSIADGLPSQFVFQTYQQRNGFIWFATNNGASRFDGQSFRHFFYSPGSANHITSNFVRQIFEDKLGNIWMLTEDGLNKVNPNGDIEYFTHDASKPDSINSNWQHSIYQDSSDRIWIGTNEGLNLYQAETNTFNDIVGLETNTTNKIPVNQIIEINKDRFILGTLHGIAFFNASDHTFTLASELNTDTPEWYKDAILTMTRSRTGQVLIGTQSQGLIIYKPDSDQYEQYKVESDGMGIAENAVVSIIERPDGELLIGQDHSGLTLISADRQTFSYLYARDFDDTSLISNQVNHLFEDQSGLLWVSTRLGVSTYSNLKNSSALIRKQADLSGLSGMVVFNTVPMNNEHMLIASSGGVDKLRYSDRQIQKIDFLTQAQKGLAEIEYKDLTEDSNGNFWFASAIGLHQYKPLTGEVVNYLNTVGNPWGLKATELFTILADPKEGVWITGHEDVGLSKFTSDKGVVERYMEDPLNSYTKGRHFTIDKIMSKNGDLWLATTNGVYRVNPQSGLEQHIRMGTENRENILSSSIIEDPNGTIWATTQGEGLVKLTINEDNSVEKTHFTIKEGLVSNELLTVSAYQDKLWLTTKDQLFSYDTETRESTAYPSLLNLPGLIFEAGSQTMVDELLYLGSNQGLVIVDLNKIERNQFNSPIQITEVKSDEKTLIKGLDITQQKKAYIPHENNNLSFTYAALDFNNLSANRYRYFLQGSDDSWVEAGNRTHVTYNNLSAGTYTFKVTATNSDGKWSDQVSVFTFEIEQSWWFYALWTLAALLGFASVLFIINRRLHLKILHQKANFDSLTGLANRYHYNNYIDELVTQTNNSFTLLIVDLDGFKEVNDIYGHPVGDELLVKAAARMKKVLRDGDLLARLGGDEFAIIINQHSQSKEVLKISERLRATLQSDYKLSSHVVKASASIGAASFPSDSKSSDSLLIYADTAMFAAKQSGRNSVRFFNEALSLELEKRTALMQKLQSAIQNEEFELFYQPQINQFSNQITGFESLIRWFQEDGSAIGPNIFIPEAERNGSIIEIGRWVLNSACKQAAEWHEQGLSFGKISVNVSAAQITKTDLISDVEKALQSNNLSPEFLELEITESVLVDNIDFTIDILSRLKHIGVSVALDDFGTGYSSLNYLTKFSINTLKIDRSFVQSVETDGPTRIVLKNIYTLANDLSMKVVAEGVETEAQLQILASLQGHIIQGFYYSPAVSAADATKLITDERQT